MKAVCISFVNHSSWKTILRCWSCHGRDGHFREFLVHHSTQRNIGTSLTDSCVGQRPRISPKNEVFRCIPDEIRSVATRELRPATSKCTINRQPQSVYVASSFGLCAGVLRHREISKDGFVMTSRVTIYTINGIVLHADAKEVSTFGRKLTSDVK